MIYSKLKVNINWFIIYNLYYKKIIENDRDCIWLIFIALFNILDLKNLSISLIFIYDGCVCIVEPKIINKFNLKFVVKLIFLLYKLLNLILKDIVLTNKAKIRLEQWIK